MGWLVLTRDIGDIVHSDGPCQVKIFDVRGNKVRVGFLADESTNFRRDEVEPESRETRPVIEKGND